MRWISDQDWMIDQMMIMGNDHVRSSRSSRTCATHFTPSDHHLYTHRKTDQ